MMLVESFLAEGKEYMVLDGRQGFMPGPAAVRLLMDKKAGLGGDRLLVMTGSNDHSHLMAFLPDGTVVPAGAWEQVLLRAKADFEFRVTEHFVSQLREADEETESLKQAS